MNKPKIEIELAKEYLKQKRIQLGEGSTTDPAKWTTISILEELEKGKNLNEAIKNIEGKLVKYRELAPIGENDALLNEVEEWRFDIKQAAYKQKTNKKNINIVLIKKLDSTINDKFVYNAQIFTLMPNSDKPQCCENRQYFGTLEDAKSYQSQQENNENERKHNTKIKKQNQEYER